jgi:hypothetical protein
MCYVKGKGKAVPLQSWGCPEISRKLRFPDFLTTAQDDGKVVSLTHWPHLPPGNTPGTHFCYRFSRPQGHSAIRRIYVNEKFQWHKCVMYIFKFLNHPYLISSNHIYRTTTNVLIRQFNILFCDTSKFMFSHLLFLCPFSFSEWLSIFSWNPVRLNRVCMFLSYVLFLILLNFHTPANNRAITFLSSLLQHSFYDFLLIHVWMQY